jgi:hypothetical protein
MSFFSLSRCEVYQVQSQVATEGAAKKSWEADKEAGFWKIVQDREANKQAEEKLVRQFRNVDCGYLVMPLLKKLGDRLNTIQLHTELAALQAKGLIERNEELQISDELRVVMELESNLSSSLKSIQQNLLSSRKKIMNTLENV